VTVLPPFVDIRSVQTLVDGDRLLIEYGAQDLSPYEDGAYTGDISAAMLAKLGCHFVVVGHSERRMYHGEDDETVNAKIKTAYRHGITPIVCIGEGVDVREALEHVSHCTAQLDGALAGIPAEQAESMVIAYEPVWAIGTGKVATPEQARDAHRVVRATLDRVLGTGAGQAAAILYGGSVNAGNAAALFAEADVDGALVGGASLEAASFWKIVSAARAAG